MTFELLALVLMISSSASQASPQLPPPEINKAPVSTELEPPERLKEMEVSDVPETDPNYRRKFNVEIYFPYQSSLSARLGMGADTQNIRNNIYNYVYGLQYQLASSTGRHWEIGADVMSDGTGVFLFGHKIRIHPTSAFRPYFKLSGAVHIIASEQLTTFLRSQNYQVRPAAGFEYFLDHPSSLRVEAETWVSLNRLGFHLTLGYSYAW